MNLGVGIFPTDYSIRPTDYSIRPDDFARAREERGFESEWFPEHTHIPASGKTPYPGVRCPGLTPRCVVPCCALNAAA